MQHTDEFKTLCEQYRTQINEIDNVTLQHWLDENKQLHLIDVREADEYSRGYILDAIHLSKGWIEALIHTQVPSKDAVVVLYCGSGNRSVLAAYNLKKMGYTNVYSLAGGYKNWR